MVSDVFLLSLVLELGKLALPDLPEQLEVLLVEALDLPVALHAPQLEC